MTARRPHWWAAGAVDVATLLLPPGPVRRRYRSEMRAEQWAMTTRQQAAHALSVLVAAPALHRALLESGELTTPHSPLWCRLHLHHTWHQQVTPDGERFRRCCACGLDDDGTGHRRVAGSMINAHGLQGY